MKYVTIFLTKKKINTGEMLFFMLIHSNTLEKKNSKSIGKKLFLV